MGSNTTDADSVLEQNCRPGWPLWVCIFANVCGMTSTTLWFLVLLPQVWKNFRRKSVVGLSVLWATANFTASLINLFFVFLYAQIPLYSQISSVYCPVLEFLLLVQFWLYGASYNTKVKYAYTGCCIVMWSAIVVLQVVFRKFGQMEWVAITLWCVETFPQVLLNMKRRSTSGQATGSIVIAMVGKTTDFLSNYILAIPLQYVIMIYFSSSVAYVNGLQLAWYYQGYDLEGASQTYDVSKDGTVSSTSSVHTASSTNELVRAMPSSGIVLGLRVGGVTLLTLFLGMCVIGLVWNTETWLGLLGPAAICVILLAAYCVFNRRQIRRYVRSV